MKFLPILLLPALVAAYDDDAVLKEAGTCVLDVYSTFNSSTDDQHENHFIVAKHLHEIDEHCRKALNKSIEYANDVGVKVEELLQKIYNGIKEKAEDAFTHKKEGLEETTLHGLVDVLKEEVEHIYKYGKLQVEKAIVVPVKRVVESFQDYMGKFRDHILEGINMAASSAFSKEAHNQYVTALVGIVKSALNSVKQCEFNSTTHYEPKHYQHIHDYVNDNLASELEELIEIVNELYTCIKKDKVKQHEKCLVDVFVKYSDLHKQAENITRSFEEGIAKHAHLNIINIECLNKVRNNINV